MIQLRSGRATTTDVAEHGIAHASSTIQTQQSIFGSGFAAATAMFAHTLQCDYKSHVIVIRTARTFEGL